MFTCKNYLAALCPALIVLSNISIAEPFGIDLGIDYGRTEAKKYCDHITNCSDSENNPKVDIGYEFNEHYSVELGYASFGTFSGSESARITQESHAATLSFLGTIPIKTWMSIYGRGGLARFNTVNTGVIKGVAIKDENGNTPFWGAGLNVILNEQYSVRVEFQSYMNLSGTAEREDDIQGLFFGIQSHF